VIFQDGYDNFFQFFHAAPPPPEKSGESQLNPLTPGDGGLTLIFADF
jgi:hypothetical protein